MSEPQNDFDTITKYLQTAGWTFGWCMIEEDGQDFWLADARKGDVHVSAKAKVLEVALLALKSKVIGMN